MNTRVIVKNQRKTGALFTCLIAGTGLLSSVPALATGAIYDVSTSALAITAKKATTCTITPKSVPVILTGAKINDPNAGTVDVDCGSSKVALAIAKTAADKYDIQADGTPKTGTGKLTITLQQTGATPTTMTASTNNFTGNTQITKMLVSNTAAKSTFSLVAATDATGVTAAGEFDYSLIAAAWVE